MTNTGPKSSSDKTRKSTRLTRKSHKTDTSNESVPPLKCHKRSGTAYVHINGERKYLGAKFGTAKAEKNYNKLITTWLANGRQLPDDSEELTITELCAKYIAYADSYYRHKDGTHTSQFLNVKLSLRTLIKLYGDLSVSEFSPKKLKTIMDTWVKDEISRKTINTFAGTIKRCFKWGVSEELVPGSVMHGLNAVSGLRAGRSDAKESEPVKPVSEADIAAAKEHLGDTVNTMIDLQLLTGARPGEIATLKNSDIDTSGEVWTAELSHHKTLHHGKTRTLYFGTRAQALLRPFMLKAGKDAYLFSPIQSEQERYAEAPTHRRPNQKPNERKTERTLGDHYTSASYRRAIARACQEAGIQPWSPNQLRHNAATKVRKEFGLEAAQVILGHSSADITQVYAEVDKAKALKVIREIG